MSREADFSPAVARALAERSGFVCSYPGCNAPTIGPSAETPTSTNKSGMACHIYAAATGPAARRVMTGKSIDELRSIENGVWMCYRHGKIIDGDECTFTAELLMDWRRISERKAELRHALGRDLISKDLIDEPLASYAIEIASPDFVGQIAEAFRLCDVESMWGEQSALAARDFVLEVARNALTHGAATKFDFIASHYSIRIVDNGTEFSINDLERASSPKGGAMSLKELRKHAPHIVVSYIRENGDNIIVITTTSNLDAFISSSPCVVRVGGSLNSATTAMQAIFNRTECGTIFLYPQFGVLSYSELNLIRLLILGNNLQNRDIALIIERHSRGIEDFVAEHLKNVRIIEKNPRGR